MGARLEREPVQSLGISQFSASALSPDDTDIAGAGGINPGFTDLAQAAPASTPSCYLARGIAEVSEKSTGHPAAQEATQEAAAPNQSELEDARRVSGLVGGLVHEACSGLLSSVAFAFDPESSPVQSEAERRAWSGLKLNLNVLQEIAGFGADAEPEGSGKQPTQWLRGIITDKLGQSWVDERGEPPNLSFAANTARVMRQFADCTDQLIEAARLNEGILRTRIGDYVVDPLLTGGEGFGRLVKIFADLCEGKEVSPQPRPIDPLRVADRILQGLLPEFTLEAEGVPETGAIDPELAEIVWKNLARNARDHGEPTGPVEAQLKWEGVATNGQGELVFTVSNQATLALPEIALGEHMNRIWQTGYSTKVPPSGLGLPLARWAAGRLGGQVKTDFSPEVESQDPKKLTGTVAGRFVATARLPMGLSDLR